MRFKIDENLHDDVRALLAGRGHDVHTVHDEGLRGCDDSSLALHCLNDHRALVTLDLDFADIRTFPPADCAGFVVLRVSRQSRRHVLDVVTSALPSLETKPIIGRLWIVTDSSVRIRGE